MAAGSNVDWTLLPSDVIVHVFSFLNSHDLNHASRVCHTWNEAFDHPTLWQTFEFWFFLPSHVSYLEGAKKYGKYMKKVFIGVNQMLTHNRQNACALLEILSRIDRRRITYLKIAFTGENPLFYSGQEFLDGLSILFSKVADNVDAPVATLQYVDLSGLSVPIDDRVIDALSENHTGLKYLDIQNKVIISKTTSDCILRLVERCRDLRDLRLYYCSISNEVLEAFTEHDRTDVEHISIICRREVKFGYELETEAWEDLTTRIPSLRVTLGFDHTCPYQLISAIMKPVIPVRTLKLETFAICHDEVNLAATLYNKTLEKLVLQTRNSLELEAALLKVARTCTLLRSLLVYCVVRRETINEIFRLHPDMEERGTYILKSEVEPEPWVVGVEEGD
ncbi:F-box/LRR-repeat protein 8-like [Mercenaria mercenaria]|uniref:F-box/LRR-repeat protein 8-like n=1 Tax=Mercenaria mercenaria TaxID=6596 RepID=UPI00234E7062|nr:F-box/LRR-repeat protein 8-like [Mercenaria mercenaria]XP_045193865.2 F-box/LRR-repeat protein 8-like [Mercenaria mercenaria]